MFSLLADLQKERGFPHPSRKKKLLKFKRESTLVPLPGRDQRRSHRRLISRAQQRQCVGGTSSGFNQLRNEFLTAARRVATTKKQAIGEVVEWASGGTFKYGDIGRMTEGDAQKLRAATELMASALTATSC
jgi:hypothetical protein